MLAAELSELNQSRSPLAIAVDPAGAPPLTVCSEGVTLAVWGCPLGADAQPIDLSCLCCAVAEEGEGALEGLGGHFALAASDSRRHAAWLLADRFVTHRLYYAQAGGRLWVSDRLMPLRSALPNAPSLSHQALLSYLYFHMIPSPETLFEGLYALAPAELISCSGGQLSRRRHWIPRATACSADEKALAEQLFQTLDRAVADRIKPAAQGCFLSGGLDSSSIAGLVARHRPHPDVFSIGFPIPQYNELDYARCAVNHFGLKGHEYVMQPEDVVEALPGIVASMDQPFGNSSVLPTYFCAKLAKEQGIDCLVAGDGGDELFAGNERYAHQLRLERWRQRLGPMVNALDWGLLRPPWPERPALLAKAKSFARQLKMSVPESLAYFNFLNLIDRESLFQPTVRSAVELREPDRRSQTLYDELPEGGALERMLYMDWKHTLADNDLIKVSSMCRLAGVEVVYPMLDDRLVDLSLAIPAQQKLVPGNLRNLYKVAMGGFLPQQIIAKPKHGFGLPFGLWTQEHPGLQALAYDALEALRQHGLFENRFIDEVKRRHREEHAKHYGELVWVLMVLALWLEQHRG